MCDSYKMILVTMNDSTIQPSNGANKGSTLPQPDSTTETSNIIAALSINNTNSKIASYKYHDYSLLI